MTLRIIITGGTFDKQYDAIRGQLTFKDTHLPDIIERVRCNLPIALEINQMVDSLDMQDENRQRILAACRQSDEKLIVITHGTDTMAETAALLGQAFNAGEPALAGNQRMAQPLAGMRRLADLDQVVEQEAARTRW